MNPTTITIENTTVREFIDDLLNNIMLDIARFNATYRDLPTIYCAVPMDGLILSNALRLNPDRHATIHKIQRQALGDAISGKPIAIQGKYENQNEPFFAWSVRFRERAASLSVTVTPNPHAPGEIAMIYDHLVDLIEQRAIDQAAEKEDELSLAELIDIEYPKIEREYERNRGRGRRADIDGIVAFMFIEEYNYSEQAVYDAIIKRWKANQQTPPTSEQIELKGGSLKKSVENQRRKK